jgi:hypothetical protein
VLCGTKIDRKGFTFFQNACFQGGEKITCYNVPSAYTTKFQRGFYIYLLDKACISQQEYGAELNVRAFPFVTLQMCSPLQKLPYCLTSPWLQRLTNLRLGSSSKGFAQIKFVTLL